MAISIYLKCDMVKLLKSLHNIVDFHALVFQIFFESGPFNFLFLLSFFETRKIWIAARFK